MDPEELENITSIIAKGNTTAAEALFSKPGGRKYLESIVLLLVCNLEFNEDEKEDVFIAFHRALDKIEKRIKRQKEGQRILSRMYQ